MTQPHTPIDYADTQHGVWYILQVDGPDGAEQVLGRRQTRFPDGFMLPDDGSTETQVITLPTGQLSLRGKWAIQAIYPVSYPDFHVESAKPSALPLPTPAEIHAHLIDPGTVTPGDQGIIRAALLHFRLPHTSIQTSKLQSPRQAIVNYICAAGWTVRYRYSDHPTGAFYQIYMPMQPA